MPQWLRFIAPHAGNLDLIPGQGTKIPHVAIKTRCSQINKYLGEKRYRDFSGGPVAKTPNSQCSVLGFNPWPGNYILHATIESSHAAMKIKDTT